MDQTAMVRSAISCKHKGSLTGRDEHQPGEGRARQCACVGSSVPPRWPPKAHQWTACSSPWGTRCSPGRLIQRWKKETQKRNSSILVTEWFHETLSCDFASYLVSRHDAHHWKENNWQHGSYSQGHALCTPVQGHDDDGIAAFCFLQTRRHSDIDLRIIARAEGGCCIDSLKNKKHLHV